MQQWRVNQRRKQLGGEAHHSGEGGGFRTKNEQLELVQNNIQIIQRKCWAKAFAPKHFKWYFGATLYNASGCYFILFGALKSTSDLDHKPFYISAYHWMPSYTR